MNVAEALSAHVSREYINKICDKFRHTNAKFNNNQEIIFNIDNESAIATVCIKSGAKNAISAKMMIEFLDILDKLYSWDQGRGVLIYGHDGFFCSGGDLTMVNEILHGEDDGIMLNTLMRYNLARLQNLPMLSMALIQGKAIGGGAEIAVACDMRLMTKSARIGYVHSRVGICSAWGGGSRLVQLIGPSRAIELMTSARNVTSDEALQIGLINHILYDYDESNLDATLRSAQAYLKNHITGAKSTITAIKGIVNAARHLPLEQALVIEGQLLASTWGRDAHLQALSNNVKHRDV